MLCYDIVGDIHGQAEKLKALLRKLGYREGPVWKAPAGHQAIFLGDLIDRGPGKLETVAIVRGMRDAGEAQCVMGNHEFNAIGYATPRRDEPGEFLRRHNAKNDAQHREFLNQVGEGSPAYLDLLGWFKTLPAFLDLGAIRVVHAWWNQQYVDLVNSAFWNGDQMDESFLHASYHKGSPQWAAMEGLIKGLETPLPEGASFLDHDGFRALQGAHTLVARRASHVSGHCNRRSARSRWNPCHLPASGEAFPQRTPGAPIFIGHYWMQGTPVPQAADVACVDYSAARDGPLVAYRWQGESVLTASHFVLSA